MADCACVYSPYEGDPPEFESTTQQKARKVHICCECGRKIMPGEKYERTSGMWDGAMQTFRICADCLSVLDSFFCDGRTFECMWDDLYEHIRCMRGEIASSCLVSLTPAARKDVCEMIEEQWEREVE